MKFTVILEPGENGYIVAHCPALKGCWSQGKSESEALANIKEAIEGWLEVEAEKASSEASKEAKVCEIAV
jgi:predicted RNase H-like HicB family nuclease